MSHIFVSYSKKNKDYAQRLKIKLLAEGFNVWIDEVIEPSNNWWDLIVTAIEQCAAFVVVMTPDSKKSKWVQREVALAEHQNKPMFPLLRKGENWPLFVLTQYELVSSGQLPPDRFYTELEKYLARSSQAIDLTPQQQKQAPQSLSWLKSFLTKRTNQFLILFAVLVVIAFLIAVTDRRITLKPSPASIGQTLEATITQTAQATITLTSSQLLQIVPLPSVSIPLSAAEITIPKDGETGISYQVLIRGTFDPEFYGFDKNNQLWVFVVPPIAVFYPQIINGCEKDKRRTVNYIPTGTWDIAVFLGVPETPKGETFQIYIMNGNAAATASGYAAFDEWCKDNKFPGLSAQEVFSNMGFEPLQSIVVVRG